MATLGYLLLASACLAVNAFPDGPVTYRNTIFGDEKLEGAVFENVDAFNDIVALTTADNNEFRLPTTTRPQHYNIRWTINIIDLSFSGEVDIDLYATQQNVNEIVIHAHDLNITSLSLQQGTTTVFQTYSLQPEYHFLRVRLNSGSLAYNAATPVIYRLTIAFNAPLRTDMYGIYRSWFRDGNTEEISWMASTQFQATAARYAFPCYDEPSFKAEFDISITRPVTHRSWSCTRLQETRPTFDVTYEEDVFLTTPVMSTYLLALIVAQYDSQSTYIVDASGNEVLTYEVIARRSALADRQGDYAFYVGQDLLEEMSSHTDIDFYSVSPNLKMTQAAIPDFGAGAMENWGLLTYREAYLMYSPQHTNGYFQQLIAYILSHEIAHMWFGNLVTCDWWNVLWLNEGFARYYQYFLTDSVEEELGLGIRFIPEQVHTSLLSDSADNPQPLSHSGVGSPASVSAMFSTISYNKGAAIIRMTEHLMGYENHRQGLRDYLRTRAHQSALPIDLFEDLQAAAVATGAIAEYGPDFSIVDYYRTWTEQGGHPVLNVHVNHQNGQMTIYQRRFNINSGYATANTNWIVPITFATATNPDFNNTKPTHIIRDAITIIDRGSVGDEWVIFNKQQTGFYRVNYDEYTWDLIIMLLRGPQRELVHEYNRAQIVNDVFQFARSGVMSYTRAFNILSFMQSETAYTPWLAAITGFNWVNARVIGTSLETPLNNVFLSWAANVMSELTYYPQANEDFMVSYLRYQLAPVMCRLGNAECLAAATTQFNNLVTSGIEVPVNSRNWVYCNALRQGTVADFTFLYNRFLEHHVYTEKIQLLMVLGCTPHETALNTFMSAIVEDNYLIRPQDYTTAFNSAVTGNEGNTQIAFRFIQNNIAQVTEAFGNIVLPLSYVSSRLRTLEEVNEFRAWATANQGVLGASYNAVLLSSNSAVGSIEYAASIEADISNYLNTGDSEVQFTTAAPIVSSTVQTVTAAPISEPSTPDLPGSASSTFLSATVLIIAFIAKFIV